MTTDRGTGLVLPLSKAIFHVMNVHTAISREWPMTSEEALAELTEAGNHLNDMTNAVGGGNLNLVSEHAEHEYAAYRTRLTAAVTAFQNTVNNDPAELALHTTHLPALQDLVRQSWSMLSLFDFEFAGLDQDPGTLP